MDRKYIFIGGMVLFVFLGCVLFLFGGREVEKEYAKRDKTHVENYIMYVKAGALVKLNIEDTYENCDEGKCLRKLIVTSYELIDSKASKLYDDIDLLEKYTLNSVVNEIVKISLENDSKLKEVVLYTDADDLKEEIDLKAEVEVVIDVDTAHDLILLHEGKDALKDETTTTAVDKKTSKKFSLDGSDVAFKNKKSGFKYTIDEDVTLSVTVKGMASDLDKIAKIDLYVNVKSLNAGKKKIKVYVDNDNEDVTFTVSPSSISVTAVDTNKKDEEPSEEVTTTKPVDNDNEERVGINLNDNVQYAEGTACYNLVYVEPVCLTSTIKELKEKYPDYNKELDEDTSYSDDDKFNKNNIYSLANYFPSCIGEIPSSTKSKLENIKGFLPVFKDKAIEPNWIVFKDSSYDKYIESDDFSKYSIYVDSGCGDTGGSGNVDYSILDESICKKYNLTCDRW